MTEIENILEFYDNELNLIAEEFCEKFKDLSTNIIENNYIEEKPKLKQLKIYLRQLLNDYPHFKRYGNLQSLLSLLIKKENQTYIYKIGEGVIFEKIFSLEFSEILQNFKEKYEKLVNTLSSEVQEYFETLPCCATSSDALLWTHYSLKDLVIKYAMKDYKKSLNIEILGAYKAGKLLLKDELLSHLSFDIKTNLSNDVIEFLKIFENNNDTDKFVMGFKDNLDFGDRYLYNGDLSPPDRIILDEIFTKYTANMPALTKYEKDIVDLKNKLSYKMERFMLHDLDAIPEEDKLFFIFEIF